LVPAALQFGERLLRQQANLTLTKRLLFVGRGNLLRRVRIEPPQHAMKMAGGMRVGAGTQSLAQFLGALWDFGKAIQQRAQIQSCPHGEDRQTFPPPQILEDDRKSTRLNSSHGSISYAVFCLKKKKRHQFQLVGDGEDRRGSQDMHYCITIDSTRQYAQMRTRR